MLNDSSSFRQDLRASWILWGALGSSWKREKGEGGAGRRRRIEGVKEPPQALERRKKGTLRLEGTKRMPLQPLSRKVTLKTTRPLTRGQRCVCPFPAGVHLPRDANLKGVSSAHARVSPAASTGLSSLVSDGARAAGSPSVPDGHRALLPTWLCVWTSCGPGPECARRRKPTAVHSPPVLHSGHSEPCPAFPRLSPSGPSGPYRHASFSWAS